MKSLSRFLIVGLLLAALAAELGARQPNVVVILTDDQGWGDLSHSGNTNLATPHLDSIARDGASFESFYVCQVCAPTRAEFLTGRYHPRTGVNGVSRGEERLDPTETTIADIFREAGYATGAFGKWHNGTQPPYHPNDRGFDEYYGFTSGHWGHYFSPPLDHNGRQVRGDGFIVDDLTNHAIDFVEANRERPFFCYLPLNTPHSPMMVPDRFYEPFDGAEIDMRHRDPEREDLQMTRAALAMVENIDWNVGRLLKRIDDLELREETIVVFFSDNGPNSYRWNGGMKGRKGSIDEGGLRSPLFVRWPERIAAGKTILQIAGAIDLLPTLAALADVPLDGVERPLDGRSLRPLLTGETVEWQPRQLFAFKGRQNGNQVSVRTPRFRLDNAGRLFDIENDPDQRVDVSQQHPQLTARLKRAAHEHRLDMERALEPHQDRPFTLGYATQTTLPARDGIPHGTIERSSKAPNNSFFTHWTDEDDAITWDVDVVNAGEYHVEVLYTCAEENLGAIVTLSAEHADRAVDSTSGEVTEAFDPPLYDKSKERVEKSHYFVKDFKPLSLGSLHLPAGRMTLRLHATAIPGDAAIDVHSLELTRQ